MTKAAIKRQIKTALKGILAFSSPLFSKKTTMDPVTARENLLQCSPRPAGSASAGNRIVEPVCDLQIVIPAYNVEKYLADCMDSVLAQKTKYSFRVILIDDGSTDQTPGIADKYARDDRVTVIHQRNRGFSGARNVGLSEIFGKYIMFVDSDDMLCQGAIEALLDTAFAHDCDVVEGGAYYLSETGETVMYRYDSARKIDAPSAVFHGQPWAKVYKAGLFEHLCFPEGFWYEDSILAFFVWPEIRNAYTVPEMTYYYRMNQAGITATSKGKPKAIDTYWITEELMAERAQAGLAFDALFLDQMLIQIHLNHYRVAALSREIQESMFVLSCELIQQYFSPEVMVGSHSNLLKSLQSRDFGAFRMCCMIF